MHKNYKMSDNENDNSYDNSNNNNSRNNNINNNVLPPIKLPEIPLDPRKDLVNLAVNFLQNESVQSSSVKTKKQFLNSKGLSESEIIDAFKIAGVSMIDDVIPFHQNQPSKSLLELLKEYSFVTVVVGSVVYVVYEFFKKYILPYIMQYWNKQSTRFNEIDEGINSLNDKIDKSTESMLVKHYELESELKKIGTGLDKITSVVVNQTYSDPNDLNKKLKSLSTELTSLKGLILSSNRFPATPVNRPPVIPSWQLKKEEKSVVSDSVVEQSNGDGDKHNIVNETDLESSEEQ